jgi:hypothetical protein
MKLPSLFNNGFKLFVVRILFIICSELFAYIYSISTCFEGKQDYCQSPEIEELPERME